MYYKHKLPVVLLIATTIASAFAVSTAAASSPQGNPAANSIPLNIPNLGNAQRPSYFPLTFQAMGKIHGLGNQGQIRVRGSSRHYTLSPNLLVHSLSTEFASRHDLHPGAEIGFSFDPSTNTITEIWLLPDGSLAEH